MTVSGRVIPSSSAPETETRDEAPQRSRFHHLRPGALSICMTNPTEPPFDRWLTAGLNRVWSWSRGIQGRRRSELFVPGFQVGLETDGPPGRAPRVVSIPGCDLARHVYLLGASGSGKSRAMELLVRQHIQSGIGFCVVDPHGDLIRSICAFMCIQVRTMGLQTLDRIYLVEPFEDDGIVGLNVLDPLGGQLYPHVSELVASFRRLWSSSWGPRLEQLLREALLVLARSGDTLADLPEFLTNQDCRKQVLQRLNDPFAIAFWAERFDPLSDAARLAMAEPVLNKIGALLADPRLRAMLGQRTQCLAFRRLMDDGAWVLINLSKGRLRDASQLLGSVIVAQIQSAAMGRAAVPESDRRAFTLLVDEFQNFRSDEFEVLLCEARKYGVRLVVANQVLSQLDGSLQDAVFGNIGTHIVLAVSPKDAGVVTRQLAGERVTAQDLIHLPVGHAVFHQRGKPAQRIRILPVVTPAIEPSVVDEFMARLRQQHGRSLADVNRELVLQAKSPRSAKPRPNRRGSRSAAPALAPDTPRPSVPEADDD